MARIAALPGSQGVPAPHRGRVVLAVASALAVMVGLAGVGTGRALTPQAPVSQAVQLTGSDDITAAASDGTAFVMGGSGIPLPSEGYVNAADLLYLQPHGFTGTAHSLFTPELTFPGNVSEVQGAQILADAIQQEIAGGGVDADNPVYVFGYSQSSAMSSMTMEQLHHEGVPAEDV